MSTSLLAFKVLTAGVPFTGAWSKLPHRNEVNGPAMGWTIQAVETAASGTVTATIIVEVSDDGVNALTLGTITLNAATPAIDGFAFSARWQYIRVRVTAMSAASTINVHIGW